MITCTFEDGGNASLRHITVNGIIMKGNEVLLCKRGTYNGKPLLESGKYALIGGFFDRDETLVEALHREIHEETRCIVKDVTLFRIVDSPLRPKEDRQNVEFVFTCQLVSQDNNHSDEEVRELQWFSLDELPPKESWAFDHYDDIMLFKKHLKQPMQLPILG